MQTCEIRGDYCFVWMNTFERILCLLRCELLGGPLASEVTVVC